MNSRRKQRVEELIKNKTSQIIQKEIAPELKALPTVMRVEMSDDLKYAKIFISLYGSDEARERSFGRLKRSIREIRAQLGGSLRLRHLPFLTFVEDKSLDHAFRIEEILKNIDRDERE